jgi:hypothetical protein
MDFFEKYSVSPIPMGGSAAEKSRPTPQERARFRLLQQCDVQKEILTAQKEGREFTLQRNGKNSKPRAFWIKAGDQIAFTPRLGNKFLIEKGHGVLVNNLDKLGEVLADFRSAVEAGGLDTRIMEIVGARKLPSGPTGTKRRGRPPKQPS